MSYIKMSSSNVPSRKVSDFDCVRTFWKISQFQDLSGGVLVETTTSDVQQNRVWKIYGL